jgi:hypothetical protein
MNAWSKDRHSGGRDGRATLIRVLADDANSGRAKPMNAWSKDRHSGAVMVEPRLRIA